MTHSVWRGKETLWVWIPPPGAGGVSRVQQAMRLQSLLPLPPEAGRWKPQVPIEAKRHTQLLG